MMDIPSHIFGRSLSAGMLVRILLLLLTDIIYCSAVKREELVSSRLVIRYNPPVSVAVREHQQVVVELLVHLNLSDLLTPSKASDDDQRIPLWIRCPGRITAVPQPSQLLDILNDSIDVIPENFFSDINTTLILRGKELGHVNVVLYWELTDATLCVSLPEEESIELERTEEEEEEITHEDVTVAADFVSPSVVTIPAMSMESLSESSSTTAAGSTIKSTTTKPTMRTKKEGGLILKKKFKIVRKTSPKIVSQYESVDRPRRSVRRTDNDGQIEKQKTRATNAVEFTSERILIARNYMVHILREESLLDTFLMYITISVTSFGMFLIGFRVKLDDFLNILKKPVGPAIVFACHFVIFPLVSYGFAMLCLDNQQPSQLGLFALGCSPGAVLANSWTFLFGADINLSLAMTLTSTLCAFFMLPLWMNTIGQNLLPGVTIVVPYVHLLISLAIVLVPLVLSVLISHYYPKAIQMTKKVDYALTICIILLLNTLAIVSWIQAFHIISKAVAVLGLGIACLAYIIGAGLAKIFKMDNASALAISIEATFQNPEIPFLLLQLTLPKPDSDINCVPYVVQAQLCSIPILIFSLLCKSRTYYFRVSSKNNRSQERAVEPLMEIGVDKSDIRYSPDPDNSYVSNEPLTTDLRNEANSVSNVNEL